MINYYEVLGIAPNSTAQEIKKSFRKRAKEIHPDVRPLAEQESDEEMRVLLAAYEVLSDIAKRDEYDRALNTFLHVRGFDYREFLRRRANDPLSQSKLIFHDLLANHQDEAVELYERLTSGGFHLESYLSREDYMDCAFLLAEVFEQRGRYHEAFELYRKLYLYERDKPYFHHFIDEVVDRLRVLLCFKMLPQLPSADAIARLKDLLRLGFSRKDNAFFCKKLAEVYASMGQHDTALQFLRKGLELDHKLSGVKKLMERLGSAAVAQVST
ncbi:MAG TPA: J domain-containing protein [Spirochaetia bacterium]